MAKGTFAQVKISAKALEISIEFENTGVLPAYCWQNWQEQLLSLGVPMAALTARKNIDISKDVERDTNAAEKDCRIGMRMSYTG